MDKREEQGSGRARAERANTDAPHRRLQQSAPASFFREWHKNDDMREREHGEERVFLRFHDAQCFVRDFRRRRCAERDLNQVDDKRGHCDDRRDEEERDDSAEHDARRGHSRFTDSHKPHRANHRERDEQLRKVPTDSS